MGLAAMNNRMGRHGQPRARGRRGWGSLSWSRVGFAAAPVLAHHADGPEAQLGVAADRLLIGGRRVNGDPVMTTLLEQELGQQPGGLAPRPRPW